MNDNRNSQINRQSNDNQNNYNNSSNHSHSNNNPNYNYNNPNNYNNNFNFNNPNLNNNTTNRPSEPQSAHMADPAMVRAEEYDALAGLCKQLQQQQESLQKAVQDQAKFIQVTV
jgi:hypothetical protein